MAHTSTSFTQLHSYTFLRASFPYPKTPSTRARGQDMPPTFCTSDSKRQQDVTSFKEVPPVFRWHVFPPKRPNPQTQAAILERVKESNDQGFCLSNKLPFGMSACLGLTLHVKSDITPRRATEYMSRFSAWLSSLSSPQGGLNRRDFQAEDLANGIGNLSPAKHNYS